MSGKKLDQPLATFFGNFKEQSFEKGEIIIRGDDEPLGVYFVKSGYIKMSSPFENGSELAVNVFKPGSFFPMIWAIGEVPNSYYYQAMTLTKVWRAPKAKLLEFLRRNPEILLDLTRRVLVGLDGILFNLKCVLTGSSVNRVAACLFVLAKRFGRVEARGKITISLPVTHQDIANFSGLTRETVTLAIDKLKKKGVITSVRRKLSVVNFRALEKIFLEPNFGSSASPSL